MQEVKDLYEGLSLFSDKLNHKKKYYNHMSRAKSWAMIYYYGVSFHC